MDQIKMTKFSLSHISPVEKITIAYIFLTSIIIAFLPWQELNVTELYGSRIIILLSILLLAFINHRLPSRWINFVRFLFLLSLLSFWYPDTYNINKVILNHDNVVAQWDQSIFGCQPAWLFSARFPQLFVSELMNMGYFSYYPMILGVSLFFFFREKEHFNRFLFILLTSFYLYYLIFVLYPTAGPQFYFHSISPQELSQSAFPSVGHYFSTNHELHESAHRSGLFFHLVEHTQQVGERPTAAFPSSHVGISTLIMLLLYRYRKLKLMAVIFPFYLALVLATVYIQAHYVVDAVAGFLSAFLFYAISSRLYAFLVRSE